MQLCVRLSKHTSKHEAKPTPETEAEVAKFTNKYNSASAEFRDLTAKIRNDIRGLKLLHDSTLDTFLITTVVTQADMLIRAGKRMEELLRLLPQDKVEAVRKGVSSLIDGSGKAGDRLTREHSVFIESPTASANLGYAPPPPGPSPGQQKISNTNPFTATANPFEGDDDDDGQSKSFPSAVPVAVAVAGSPNQSVAATSPVSAGSSETEKKRIVVALYDAQPEEADELVFVAGDEIEVA